ncbi:unnamed protein product, partial [Discosporangium mesarthrocarpum]
MYVCVCFPPFAPYFNDTIRLYDVETGECLHTLLGHTAEIVSLNFDTNGQHIITGSFDHTVKGKHWI